jgi:acyl-coenzyme A synthetase/AMP-(fatty) acid ligase
VFHIRAKNRISDITGPERTIEIVIAPPFWATWLAYFLYAALVAGIVYSLYRNHQNRQKEKMALAIEKIEKKSECVASAQNEFLHLYFARVKIR